MRKDNIAKATAARYCLPQPTVYEWLITMPPIQEDAATKLLIAVPTAGQPRRLNPQTLKKLR